MFMFHLLLSVFSDLVLVLSVIESILLYNTYCTLCFLAFIKIKNDTTSFYFDFPCTLNPSTTKQCKRVRMNYEDLVVQSFFYCIFIFLVIIYYLFTIYTLVYNK